GIILVTGPTGSGKTTTLYSVLQELNTSDVNIVTVEDPVELPLTGISQTQVNPKAGFTFADTLRAMLRQDPDIIMVGEIRDEETLQSAVFAALTGHLVISTIHTNDAASTPLRLLDMGLKPYLAVSALRGVVAQRLVRRLCQHCREPAGMMEGDKEQVPVYRPKGCSRCADSGFSGRVGVYELLLMNEQVQDLIAQSAPAHQLRQAADQANMPTMADDALEKVATGITTPDEVSRALGPNWFKKACRPTLTAPSM
ncbi:MAG: GspE/PulE family protein, partial [Cyanobacteria bacterium REEB65]|nr:GspE/PulE family protein [Cyanobacteria bacterium REEB65]